MINIHKLYFWYEMYASTTVDGVVVVCGEHNDGMHAMRLLSTSFILLGRRFCRFDRTQ